MPRQPRITFPGALYHVFNHGNPGAHVFGSALALRTFESALLETCRRMGWLLYSYALLPNKFHLVIQTPRANLVEGMHWLETSFAVRSHRFRVERGHLFHGRYRALLVEPGSPLVGVVNQVHLLPLREGVVKSGRLAAYRWGSLRAYTRGRRPRCLASAPWLGALGLRDNPRGWTAYQTLLGWLATLAPDPAPRGWAVGSPGWREKIRERQARPADRRRLRARLESEWRLELDARLARAGRTVAAAAAAPKGAAWKRRIARAMRQATTVTNRWLAQNLAMGSAGSVSVLLGRHS